MGANDFEKTEKKDIPGDVPNLDDAVSWHVVPRSLIKHVPFWFPKKTLQFEYLFGKPYTFMSGHSTLSLPPTSKIQTSTSHLIA